MEIDVVKALNFVRALILQILQVRDPSTVEIVPNEKCSTHKGAG